MFPTHSFCRPSPALRNRIPAAAAVCAVVLICVALNSCVGHYCIMGVFNPGGTITGNNGGCVNNKATGNVLLDFTSANASTGGPMAPNLLHLFVTVHGIEANPDAMASEDSPDWEELAPDLVLEPMQIDLLAHPAISCPANRVSAAIVPAGAYRQIRLRLTSNRPATVEAVPAENACGQIGLHCAVSPDGHVHPLAFDGDVTTLRVAPERITGGLFHVLPDTDTHLTVKFSRFASFAAPSGDAVQLTPVFTLDTAASCGTASPSEQ